MEPSRRRTTPSCNFNKSFGFGGGKADQSVGVDDVEREGGVLPSVADADADADAEGVRLRPVERG
jgi:hypothetical protein